jgi:Fe-S-cluster-containing hydrogenase component 2
VYKLLTVDSEKCNGCGVCELACSAKKDRVFNPAKSRIRMAKIEPTIDTAVVCRFCEDAPCIAACPRDALTKSEKNGVILVDEKKCTGCGWCIEACDFGAISRHPEKRVVICDLCEGEPACVKACVRDALKLTTSDVISGKYRISAVKSLFKE